ncbi:MAG TPA: hypothetical protein VGQ93_10710 [Lysobacter sp.]|jgi:hypothetical protein|nr:hypothetical protein [Lysobacter sp.]
MPRKRHARDPAANPEPNGDGAPAGLLPAETAEAKPAAHTLLVRLWKEAHAGALDQPIWRGTVSDLRGRQLGSFSSAAELAGILGDMAGLNVLLRVSCVELSREPLPAADAP